MNTITINMQSKFGTFLANGNLANKLCTEEIMPAVKRGEIVVIDMSNIENMTDSFGNALIANMVKLLGNNFFESIKFSNCSDIMKKLIILAINFGKTL